MTTPTHNPTPQRISYINFVDVIDDKKAKGLMQVCSEYARDSDVIYMMISSPGGHVDLGITLFNFIRALPIPVITHNIGTVESIANVVFLAGRLRYASPNSRFLLHGVFWQPPVGSSIFPAQLAETGSRIRDDEVRIKEILTSETKITDDQIDNFFRYGESKNANFALEQGMIAKIVDARIQPGSKLFSCNFQ